MHAKANDVTAEQVRELLSYDPETGDFHWTDSPKNGKKRGRKVGTVAANGYVMIRVFDRVRLGHRLAWLMTYGDWPQFTIDHVNHDRGDNRLANLRDVPHVANTRNHPKEALMVGATRAADGTWSSGVHEYNGVEVTPGFLTPAEANAAYAKAQKLVRNPRERRPKLRLIADRG